MDDGEVEMWEDWGEQGGCKRAAYRRRASRVVKCGSYDGMTNCTLPRDLYKKCRSTVPGTMSVAVGRPAWTEAFMALRLLVFSSSSITESRILRRA